MNDHLIDLPLTRDTLTTMADPRTAHRLMATHLPDMSGRSTAIRADTGTQFRIDLPNDPLGAPGVVRMRLRGPVLPDDLGTIVPVGDIVEPVRVVLVAAAEKRKTDARGVRVRAVTDAEAPTWAGDLLARHGLTITDLACSPARRYGSPGGVHFTVRDLAATLTPTDPEQIAQALARGIGRGRAYGLGMLIPVLPTSR